MLEVGSSPKKYSALTSQAFPFFLKKVRFWSLRSRNPEIVPSMLLAFFRVEIVWVSLPSRKAVTLSWWQTISSSLAQQYSESCDRELHRLFSITLTLGSSCLGWTTSYSMICYVSAERKEKTSWCSTGFILKLVYSPVRNVLPITALLKKSTTIISTSLSRLTVRQILRVEPFISIWRKVSASLLLASYDATLRCCSSCWQK